MGIPSHTGRCLVLTAAVLALSSGCGPEGSLDPADLELATSQLPLTQVTSFGSNPGNLKMYMHVPAAVQENAGLVVALHGCAMSGADEAEAGWNEVANAWKSFYVIYPDKSGGCFAWFDAVQTKRGAGEVASVKSMVDYAKSKYSIDSQRVFVTGLSAGGGLASSLLAAYPDVFSAGAIFAGLPAGCTMNCMGGTNKTPKAWGDAVRSAHAGHSGPYPRVQIWHGSSDTFVSPSNLTELMEQWTDVNGVDQTADQTSTVSGATRNEYRNAFGQTEVETWSVPGMGHGTPIDPTYSATNGCGKKGTFSLDVKLCSSYHAALFFGLEPGGKTDAGLRDAGTDGGEDAETDAGTDDAARTRGGTRNCRGTAGSSTPRTRGSIPTKRNSAMGGTEVSTRAWRAPPVRRRAPRPRSRCASSPCSPWQFVDVP